MKFSDLWESLDYKYTVTKIFMVAWVLFFGCIGLTLFAAACLCVAIITLDMKEGIRTYNKGL